MPETVEQIHMSLLDLAEAPLRTDDDNARIHGDRNKKAIADSLDEVGGGRSIVVDETGRILAGNGTYEEAKKKGMKVLIVDRPDRNTLIAVRVSDLDAREKVRLALWDNKAAELAKWDAKALNRLVFNAPTQGLLDGVFTEREKDKLLFEQENAQELAPGGAEETDAELVESGKLEVDQTKPAESQVRMVQLFLTVTTQPAFVLKVRSLGKALGTKTITDTVFAVVERAHKEWVDANDSTNNPAA